MFLRGETNSCCARIYIKRAKNTRFVGIASLCTLIILSLIAVFPIYHKSEGAEAIPQTPTTTLDIVSSKTTASVEITPTGSEGTFVISGPDDQAEFAVTTNNLTGYSVTILGTDASGQLKNTASSDTIDTLTADVDEDTFRNGSASTYNNKWGYRLNINSTTTTDFFSAPLSTSNAKTIYTTTSKNTVADNYKLTIGARVDYTKPSGIYTNTFVITAVANNVAYQIDYTDTIGSGVSGMPSQPESGLNPASSVILSSQVPKRSGYAFAGWCDGTVDHNNLTNNASTCNGNIYGAETEYKFAGHTSSLSPTTSTNVTLVAMWGVPIQNLSSSTCTTTASTAYDVRDGQAYTIKRLLDGNCWMINNLNLGASALSYNLTSADTNLSATITSATFNGWKRSIENVDFVGEYTTGEFIPSINTADGSDTDSTTGTKYGMLYNYYAASAGTVSGATNTSNASYDICPAGWRLPVGGAASSNSDFENIASKYSNLNSIHGPISSGGAAFALSGSIAGSNSGGTGLPTAYFSGNYWSSTRNSNTNMYRLLITNQEGVSPQIYPAGNNDRRYGQSIRCVMKDTMQSFTTQDASNMAVNETRTLVDSRDGQIYKVTKLSNGKVWMTRNLAFGCNGSGENYGDTRVSISITSADSHIINPAYTFSYTPSSANDLTSANTSSDYTNPRIHCSSAQGAWYNFTYASAGHIVGSSNSNNASIDVCPAGWSLPASSDLSGPINSYANFNLATSSSAGFYRNGSLNTISQDWWSSTAGGATGRYILYWNGSGAPTSRTDDSRTDGFYIRCIKQ